MSKAEATVCVGIDEAGRGPLAGPLAVGLVCAPHEYDFAPLVRAGLCDSKQMTERAREAVFALLRQDHTVRYVVIFTTAATIDKKGIAPCVRSAIARGLARLDVKAETNILLDGGLIAPAHFRNQQTIIRGDQSEPIISLAAVAAKVTRDRYMVRMGKRFPAWGFERHKGYGTLAHRKALLVHGSSPLHRRTFLWRH